MRLKAQVWEGDKHTTVLVPLSTFIAFKAEKGFPLNDCIPLIIDGTVVKEGVDFADWEPWVAHHASTKRAGETRSYDEWADAVDWVEMGNADEADPSGGEDTPTQTSSPASSSPATSTGSSTSTTTSKKRSGTRSAAKS